MIRLLATIALQFIATAVGLLVASLFIEGFEVNAAGLIVSAVIFTIANVILDPLIVKVSFRYVPALRGGIALVTTFFGLWLTDMLTDGLTINGVSTLFVSAFVVWIAILLASIILPLYLFKEILQNRPNPDPTRP